jgi:hypothetical protein
MVAQLNLLPKAAALEAVLLLIQTAVQVPSLRMEAQEVAVLDIKR